LKLSERDQGVNLEHESSRNTEIIKLDELPIPKLSKDIKSAILEQKP
jgi:hypothetical protein